MFIYGFFKFVRSCTQELGQIVVAYDRKLAVTQSSSCLIARTDKPIQGLIKHAIAIALILGSNLTHQVF